MAEQCGMTKYDILFCNVSSLVSRTIDLSDFLYETEGSGLHLIAVTRRRSALEFIVQACAKPLFRKVRVAEKTQSTCFVAIHLRFVVGSVNWF